MSPRRIGSALPGLLAALLGAAPAAADAAGPVTSPLGASLRLAGALVVVAVAMALSFAVYRRMLRGPQRRERPRPGRGWMAWWAAPAPAEADRVEVVSRSWVGAKESVCVVRVGEERFLLGITPSRVSLLGRLETAGVTTADTAEEAATAVPDFARALTTAAVAAARSAAPAPGPTVTGESIREALRRSRTRRAAAPDAVSAGAPLA